MAPLAAEMRCVSHARGGLDARRAPLEELNALSLPEVKMPNLNGFTSPDPNGQGRGSQRVRAARSVGKSPPAPSLPKSPGPKRAT